MYTPGKDLTRGQVEHVGIRSHPPRVIDPHRRCKWCGASFYSERKGQVSCEACKGANTLTGRWVRIRRSAEQRGIAFDLTLEDLHPFWQVPCFYCGNAIRAVQLDRVDSSLGYTPGNVVSSCFDCNSLKGTLEQGAFLDLIRRIAAHHHRV